MFNSIEPKWWKENVHYRLIGHDLASFIIMSNIQFSLLIKCFRSMVNDEWCVWKVCGRKTINNQIFIANMPIRFIVHLNDRRIYRRCSLFCYVFCVFDRARIDFIIFHRLTGGKMFTLCLFEIQLWPRNRNILNKISQIGTMMHYQSRSLHFPSVPTSH